MAFCKIIIVTFYNQVFQTVSEKMLEVAQRKPGASNTRSAVGNNEEECDNNGVVDSLVAILMIMEILTMMSLTGGKCRSWTTERSRERNLDAVPPNDSLALTHIWVEIKLGENKILGGTQISNCGTVNHSL